eukprot:CAMPEP_0114613468 /NCGR_PEP_ID=MMETSP0168-20121206/5147_1 /TAXON_ID=95228 ORGANISM="Vannella sp., Strain DIVA3 517/6/12" /NCGR_SAMPLE_ID=MMETSP0168 /ASSEMBLY_ACC=CAM_ASM_000044 /LENGTH=153 /DNA_ID=CAMNT_0001824473 /DNA_START=166 /DNA_END=624 /DNA_ORIENTATION=+
MTRANSAAATAHERSSSTAVRLPSFRSLSSGLSKEVNDREVEDDVAEDEVGEGALLREGEGPLVGGVQLDAEGSEENEGTHGGEEAGQEGVEGVRAHLADVHELDHSREEGPDEEHVDQPEPLRRLAVALPECAPDLSNANAHPCDVLNCAAA